MSTNTNILALPVTSLTLTTGNNEDWIDSIKYVFLADDGSVPPESLQEQVDLRGIKFEMEIRHRADDVEVVLAGSTEDGRILIGPYPNYGWLIFNFDDSIMRQKRAGDYVGDVVASDTEFTRRVILLTLSVVEGVTK